MYKKNEIKNTVIYTVIEFIFYDIYKMKITHFKLKRLNK
jgi:hypothetical protein